MPPTFLLRDDFITDAAAPLTSPRTAEPGPGTLITITDGNNKLSVAAGKLQFATGGVGSGDPGAWSSTQTRAIGLASILELSVASGSLQGGWDSDASGNPVDGVRLAATSFAMFANSTVVSGDTVTGGSYKVVTVLRTAGSFVIAKGPSYTNWTLLYVSELSSYATARANVACVGTTGVGSSDTLRALQLPAPFNTDFGLATQRLAGARAAGDTFVHEANCVLEWTQTALPTTATSEVRFRYQDTNNYWIIEIQTDGSLRLIERTAGTQTLRSFATAIVASGHRIVIVADGTTIRGYSNNVLRWTYASASNGQTATVGSLDHLGSGAVSDIVTWPRTITGVPASILDAAVGGSGDLTATLAAATLTATGQVGPVPITGQLTATLAAATLVSTGQVRIAGQLTAQLAPATLAAAGHVPQITAQLAVVLMAATLTATNVRVAIELGTVYGQADTATIYGQQVYGEVVGI